MRLLSDSADGDESVDRPPDETFRTQADALGSWLSSTGGRVPGRGPDKYELGLFYWRNRQLHQVGAGTLPPERERYLDDVAPGWRSRRASGVEAFQDRARELGRWMRSTGRLPHQRGGEKHERGIAYWRHSQLSQMRAGTLSPERQEYLDAVAPGWRPAQGGPEVFRAWAEELGRWLGSVDAVPSVGSDDPHERSLAAWRHRQSRQLQAGKLEPEHERYLDAVAPGWRPVQNGFEAFQARADELGRWLGSAHGVPSNSGDDPHERSLAAWRHRQLHHLRAGRLAQERQDYLDEVAPGWRRVRAMGAEGFRARADALGRWLGSAGEVPSGSSDDPNERSLAAWRYVQLERMRSGTLPPERREYLDAVAPGWGPLRGGADRFRAQAEELGRWLGAVGRFPSARSDDPLERSLTGWRERQVGRLRAGTLPLEQQSYLDEVAPGWRPVRATGVEGFRARAEELGRWLAATGGRVPSQSSDDPYELRLCGWRLRYVRRLNNGVLAPERESYLDEVAPGWRPLRATEVKGFWAQAGELGRWLAATGGKVPAQRSGDPYERRLRRWRQKWLVQLRDGTLSPEHERYLDEVAPGWCPPRVTEIERFRARAEQLGRWLAATGGKLPSGRSDDPYERQLSRWRQGWLRRLGDRTLAPEHEQYLDEVAPGWRPVPRSPIVGFPAQARALGRWMVWSEGKVPDGRSDDLYERRLRAWRHRWLRQLRTGTLPSEDERYLDEVAPGWRPRAGSGVDEFPARAEALGRWFAAGGRLPSGRSEDLHELRLHRWRRGWLFHLRNATLSPEHERYLDEVAPGWRPKRQDADRTVRAGGAERPPAQADSVADVRPWTGPTVVRPSPARRSDGAPKRQVSLWRYDQLRGRPG